MTINLLEQITNIKTDVNTLMDKVTNDQMATPIDPNEILSTLDGLLTALSRIKLEATDYEKNPDVDSEVTLQNLIINAWKNFNLFIVDKLSNIFLSQNSWLCNKINVNLTNIIIEIDTDLIIDLCNSVSYKEIDQVAKDPYTDSCFINASLKTSKEIEELILHDLPKETFDKEANKIYKSVYELNKAIMRCKEMQLRVLAKTKQTKDEQAKKEAVKDQDLAKEPSANK